MHSYGDGLTGSNPAAIVPQARKPIRAPKGDISPPIAVLFPRSSSSNHILEIKEIDLKMNGLAI